VASAGCSHEMRVLLRRVCMQVCCAEPRCPRGAQGNAACSARASSSYHVCIRYAAYCQAMRLPLPPMAFIEGYVRQPPCLETLIIKDSGTVRHSINGPPTSTALTSRTGGMPVCLSMNFHPVSRVGYPSRPWCSTMKDTNCADHDSIAFRTRKAMRATSWHAQT
jgi:hypothetical protein